MSENYVTKNINDESESSASTRYPNGGNTLLQTSIFAMVNCTLNAKQFLNSSFRKRETKLFFFEFRKRNSDTKLKSRN
jgi:hypothetical protein